MDSGKNHKWVLKLVSENLMRNRIFGLKVYSTKKELHNSLSVTEYMVDTILTLTSDGAH